MTTDMHVEDLVHEILRILWSLCLTSASWQLPSVAGSGTSTTHHTTKRRHLHTHHSTKTLALPW